MTTGKAKRRAAWAVFAAIAMLVAAILLAPRRVPPPAPAAERILASQPPPPAEPLIFAPIAAETARKINGTIPFAHDRGPAARPFALAGSPESRARAIDCLASAMWYEAGGDPRGQQAVAQVVLNRARHPAYPGTVCGVVFQGSERRTGCQFTFTCDGATRRTPPAAAFALVRERATRMLAGLVQAEVRLTTHYHTDWVHPVWSAKLEKIAQIDTHLFFRWAGAWGSAAAHRKRYAGGEPAIAALASFSPAHRVDPVAPETVATAAAPMADAARTPPRPIDLGGSRFRIFMSAARNGNVQAMTALDLCGARDYCKLTGILDGGDAVVFIYLRNRTAGFERVQWDCDIFKRPVPAQCFGKVRDIPDLPAQPKPAARSTPEPTAKTP